MNPATKTLIAVCGSGGKISPELEELAEAVGREIARRGLGLVCGGRGGIMQAACRGAKAEGGLTIGILPTYNREDANPFVDIAICTGLGEARNMVIAATGATLIAVGGEWGTLSEMALALKIGHPVITLANQGWQIGRAAENDPVAGKLFVAHTAREAVTLAVEQAGS